MNSETKISKGLIRAIVSAGLLVGTLDALAAILNFIIPTFRNPLRIFQYIASGVFGKDIAFSNETLMPAMGLIFHYLIAISWTALFFLLFPRIKWLGKQPVASGLLYGIVIWILMNRVILPLSRVQAFPFRASAAAIGVTILMLVVGLPISFLARRYWLRLRP